MIIQQIVQKHKKKLQKCLENVKVHKCKKYLHFKRYCASILSVLVELIQIERNGEQGVKL